MNDATRVEWRSWDDAAFEEARAADVPVLLSLTATWCDHCHEMDAETYAEPRIAANVNDRFVPVRVDVDRRPRVRDRYNMGGFPSTVFLAPDGTLLTGAGYLDPDGMRQVLDSVAEMWAEKGADAGRVPRALRDDETPAGELTTDIEGAMLGQLDDAFDEVAGGWGTEPKFPLPDALEFALKRDREMALRSYDAVAANLADKHEGGFYRFATERDWSGLQREKLIDENAALLRAFANAYLHTGRETYRTPAARAVEYLTTTLWNDGIEAFANSQAPGGPATDTDELNGGEATETPPVDDTVLAGPNAMAIDALLTYAAYTDDERARRYGERALSSLRAHHLADGVVSYRRTALDEQAADEQVTEGTDDRSGATVSVPHLQTQARTLRALLTANAVVGAETIADAQAVADATINELREGDSFVDAPPEGVGLLQRPFRPLDANVAMADGLVDLAIVTGEDRYRRVARETLEAFAGASDRFGPDVAAYGSVTARLLEEPLVVRVGTDAGSDLHRAALRLADHETVVIPNATAVSAGTARAERGDRRGEPATTPAELSGRIGDVLG
ncbi:DUF255 domain-containing protein [Halobacteria archaeon AArc-dxtr1]|nr:DUF255 domain-containing protein [Halobacteria archaeon AArc-dxtr1]